MIYCAIIAALTNANLFLHLVKTVTFMRISPVDTSVLDKRVPWKTLYFVNNTLRDLSLDIQRVSESAG